MVKVTRQIRSQTFVFFGVSLATVFLLCGLGLDAGLWYLDRTRMSRACDSAAITGVANFSLTSGTNDPVDGRRKVADKMRNVAVGNYYGLSGVSNTPVITSSNYAGFTDYTYTYNSTNGDAAFMVTVTTGLQNQVTRAKASARAKTRTAFMGFTGIPTLMNLNTTAGAEAQRRPRLIVLVLDRSGSMITNGGATNLPKAVINFLSLMKDDYENNQVGIVSFSAFARTELVPTTNFWLEGSNKMYAAEPVSSANSSSSVNKTNIYGMKFGGGTSADEGMRMALELMRTNVGYSDPRTVKFIVFFTDGQFNSPRMLLAAPPWTNTYTMPNSGTLTTKTTNNKLPYNAYTNLDDVAMANTTNPATYGRESNMTANTASDGNIINKLKVTLPRGSMNIVYGTNGQPRQTNWSRVTNHTIDVTLELKEKNALIVPGYVMDATVYGNNAPSVSIYDKSNMIPCGYTYDKPEDTTRNGTNLPIGPYYPYGCQYTAGDSYTGTDYWSGTTNLVLSESVMAGELFYAVIGGTTQEMKTMSQWTNGMPVWMKSYSNAMTNIITPINSNSRYFAASYHGLPKPSPWVEEGGDPYADGPTNTTPGGIIWTNGNTNINSFAFNGAPTHYYDFQHGMWTNMTRWSDSGGANFLVPYCNWKVLTYCNFARLSNVVIYTVGFASADSNILRRMANDPTLGTNVQASQPQGKFYQVTNPTQITTYFTQIAEQILAFLSD